MKKNLDTETRAIALWLSFSPVPNHQERAAQLMAEGPVPAWAPREKELPDLIPGTVERLDRALPTLLNLMAWCIREADAEKVAMAATRSPLAV